MESDKKRVVEAAEHLKGCIEKSPRIAILTGTGLDKSVKLLDTDVSFNYKDIPHFPISTVQTHPGRLLVGSMQGRQVAVMQGRFHLYEGYSPAEVAFPIRVMRELGVRILILSNAAGGLNPAFRAGDIMIITDHINLTCLNPLTGPNEDSWGIRFPDMIQAYDDRLKALAENAGKEYGIRLWKGVYVGLKGPSLETPAEDRFLRTIGAEAVGFSTVQEVISAVHVKMRVLGLSVITNIKDPVNPVPATLEEIVAVAKEASPKVGAVIRRVVENIKDDELR